MPPATLEMRSTKERQENPMKRFLVAFSIAVVIYLIFYQFIEHRRNRKGPWQVTFTNSVSGDPRIIINQPFLSITNVLMTFAGAPRAGDAYRTLSFEQPRQVPYDVPFGTCVFMDTTFLPGTVTLHLFNHEVELLPRVLVIDRQEHPWLSESTITLHPAPPSASLEIPRSAE